MELEFEILKENSKRNAVRIARWIGNDQKRFGKLIHLLFTGEDRVAVRCAWIISHCAEQYPAIIKPWISTLVKHAGGKNVPQAVQRNVARVLQFIDIPRSHQGKVANLCFDFLQNPAIPVSVKVYSMTILANIAKDEPDLKHEIVVVIEQMLPYGTAGFQSRARKVLIRLKK
ncbi:MAG: hypothetical protein WCW35_07415 [Bacteroidota bacterium]|jgi:hypothetical protein